MIALKIFSAILTKSSFISCRNGTQISDYEFSDLEISVWHHGAVTGCQAMSLSQLAGRSLYVL